MDRRPGRRECAEHLEQSPVAHEVADHEWFGWRDVIELGDITTARGTEMLLPLWIRTWGALNTPMFAFRVAR